ncbi:hypothetical protein D3C85_1546380 [compost metagenome]
MIGTRAPSTRPAAVALMKYTICLNRKLPASRFGTSRISAWPATSPRMPLIRAASSDTALSKANGPSTQASPKAPIAASLASSAASWLDGMLRVTSSVPDSTAMRGFS